MSQIEELKELVVDFRNERNWKKFHTPKNLSVSISIEASELMELFQWHDDLARVDKEDLEDEIADILIYLLLMAEVTDVDLVKAVKRKVEKNKKKYPK
ncbi:MAG: nucleotide pyrophosphohydrolase [Candidatus Saliniplasma sp.]